MDNYTVAVGSISFFIGYCFANYNNTFYSNNISLPYIQRSGKVKTITGTMEVNIEEADPNQTHIEDDIELIGNFITVNISRIVGHIYLTNCVILNLTISSEKGDITIHSVDVKNSLVINNTNGNVIFTNPPNCSNYINDTTIKTTNGPLKMTGTYTIHNVFKCVSTNGDIEIKNSNSFPHPEMANITSDNGDIFVPSTLQVQRAYSTNGEVNISRVDNIGAIITTTNGDINQY